jgi:hypothetical protein
MFSVVPVLRTRSKVLETSELLMRNGFGKQIKDDDSRYYQ